MNKQNRVHSEDSISFSTEPSPEGLQANGDPIKNLPWTHAEIPSITLSAGRAENGLPLGLEFVASFGTDEYMLEWCRALEDRMGEHTSDFS